MPLSAGRNAASCSPWTFTPRGTRRSFVRRSIAYRSSRSPTFTATGYHKGDPNAE
jgi:hypothetical protein